MVRGYNVMSGYFDDPEATAAAIDADGWLHTGDVGFLDAEGNLAITDRLKDMYVSGRVQRLPGRGRGRAAPPSRRGPGGRGRRARPPDGRGRAGRGGARRRAPTPAHLADELPAFAREQLANFKVPRRVEVVDVAAHQRQRQGPQTRAPGRATAT